MSDLYTGAMGMITFENKLNTIGNNIANSKTNAFKREMDTAKVFEESFMRILSNEEDKRIGTYHNQVHTDQVHTIFEQGVTQVTNRALDLSIMDPVNNPNGENSYHFLEVEQNGEIYLTKDGNLHLDVDGNLSTKNGAYVLDMNGNRINLAGVSAIEINETGQIRDTNGNILYELQVRSIDESNLGFLEKYGQTNYRVMTVEDLEEHFGPIATVIENFQTNTALQRTLISEETLVQAQLTGEVNVFEPGMNATIKQGMLEQSNVDIGKEMTDLIVAQKGFTSSSKVLTVMDKIKEKDANQLGM